MNDHHRLKGLKFYRFKDDSEIPDIVRLISYDEVKHEYEVTTSTQETTHISEDEIENKWIKLNPDGIVVFSTVISKDNQGEDVPDIMVNLHRIDKDSGGMIEKYPFCSCRQAVIDIFALLQDNTRYIAGMCMSQKTCPPELDYRSVLAYEKMTRYMSVAIYMDDHLSDILGLFNNRPYNDRLALIKSRDKTGIQGYQTDLYAFLHENYFMLDFHQAFNIHEIPFNELDFEDDATNRVITDYIIANTQEVPIKLYPIPYTKYIDLHDIKRKYILVCPDSYKYPMGNITLIAYDVSQTISYKDLINGGKSPTDAKKEVMRQLGWS